MEISCLKWHNWQDTPKYVIHVLGRAVSNELNFMRETVLLLEHAQVRCTRIGRSRIIEKQTPSNSQPYQLRIDYFIEEDE